MVAAVIGVICPSGTHTPHHTARRLSKRPLPHPCWWAPFVVVSLQEFDLNAGGLIGAVASVEGTGRLVTGERGGVLDARAE